MKFQLALLLSLGLCPLLSFTQPANASPPNIVLILADDLGYGDLGCYGQTRFQTPNIDRLAADGMRFTQHYAGSPVCAPSRCSLMTGKHTGNAYVRGNASNPAGPRDGQLPLLEGEETFVKYLQNAGYKTGAFGKWGLGNFDTEGSPLKHGFDEFFGYYDQILAHNSYPEFLMRNGEKVPLSNEVAYQSEELWHRGLGSVSTQKTEYSNDIILDEALAFIDRNQDVPFFLYFPTTAPHDNGEAEVGERFEVPDNSKYQDRTWTADEKSYAALVEHLDSHVGKIEAKLASLGLSGNTIILFSSDNGPLPAPNLNSNGNYRGHKRDVYEGGIRVPLIVKWPGKVRPGSQSNHISAFWDVFPTLCEATGITQIPETDGISFLPELLDQDQMEHEFLYWEFHWWKPSMQAVRQGKWKALRYNPTGPIELYNLEKDMSEINDLSSQYPEILDQMKALLDKTRSHSAQFPLKSEE
ncbi:arylsulfatase [Pelagicoccus mobilis]|uniref:Arylsulfatase n=1 Tax=Pelagicoccus mobilis TaxID=415221 RepID=A0A934S241_9BACT|nr:arylsulfatase [Pelagicoccus mobilis]MBK1877668.1 arylsulfatase [Pelagicoccus mobilis]